MIQNVKMSRICTHFYSKCVYNQRMHMQMIDLLRFLHIAFCILPFACMHHLGNCTQNLGLCVYIALSRKQRKANKTKTPKQTIPPNPNKNPTPRPCKKKNPMKQTLNKPPTTPPTNQFLFLWGCIWIGLNLLEDLFYDTAYNQSPFSDEWVPWPTLLSKLSSQSLLWSCTELSNYNFNICDLVFAVGLTAGLGFF